MPFQSDARALSANMSETPSCSGLVQRATKENEDGHHAGIGNCGALRDGGTALEGKVPEANPARLGRTGGEGGDRAGENGVGEARWAHRCGRGSGRWASVFTNVIESEERLLKHHGVSPDHFLLYLKEMEYRFNHRSLTPTDFADHLVQVLLSPNGP